MNLPLAFNDVNEYFFPHVIASFNDHYIKAVKVKGNKVPWHNHENSDELFYIVEGRLVMEIENQSSRILESGDIFVVKRGVNHRISSEQECNLVLIETKETLHTGQETSTITRTIEDQLTLYRSAKSNSR